MKDFIYNIPTKVYFGKDQFSNLGTELSRYGTRVLVTYGGGSIKKTGLYDIAMEEIKKAGRKTQTGWCRCAPSGSEAGKEGAGRQHPGFPASG